MTVTIRGPAGPIELAVDIRAELERFNWLRPQWTADKLIAASPFRYDTHPSFFVSLEHGGWRDSGASDPKWESGGFVKLLAFLNGITTEEAAEYLYVNYARDGEIYQSKETLIIPRLYDKRPIIRLDESTLEPYRFRHEYLGRRGISESVQRLMSVGFDKKRQAVTIPWRTADGKLAAVKFRSTYSRVFWYEKGGRPIGELIYGIDVVYDRRLKRAALVEGESDAMTLMTAGMPALATGGATNWNRMKADIIRRSPLEEIVLVRDNDAAGRAWQRRIIADLTPYMSVKVAVVPTKYKDVNEAYLAGVNVGALSERNIKRKFKIA